MKAMNLSVGNEFCNWFSDQGVAKMEKAGGVPSTGDRAAAGVYGCVRRSGRWPLPVTFGTSRVPHFLDRCRDGIPPDAVRHSHQTRRRVVKAMSLKSP
jgi:hypothetical protein